jgi:NhaA family Na+:H+ antiporter
MAKTASVKSTQRPIDRILSPFQEFFQQEASSGVLLIVATVLALLWANSQLSDSYFHLWETQVSVRAGQYGISKDLLHWINDGLMVIFFFVVGLEIKREVLVGELSSPRLAALPIVAAIGGMIVPAIIYVAFNLSGPARSGWAIPMATDIAFALGVLSLLGKRVPLSLKVLLTALAIVDDLGAVLVIAIFYTSDIAWTSLLVAGFVFVVLTIMNRMGVRSLSAYAIVGVCLWLAFLQSGIHATIAGVLLAMTIPVRTRINADEFASNTRIYLDEFQKHSKSGTSILTNKNQLAAIASIEVAAEHA